MTVDAPGAGLCGRVLWRGVRQPRPPQRDETRNNRHWPQNVMGIDFSMAVNS